MILDSIVRYFFAGTAEEERAFLDRAFVTHDQLAAILEVPPGAMRIIVGNKGVGKSALFEWLARVASQRKLPVLLLRPDDLDTQSIGTPSDIAALKRGFYAALVNAIATAIGRQLHGLLSDEAALLYRAAVEAGARDADFVGKILKLLSVVSVPVARVDGVQLARALAGSHTRPDELIKSISGHLTSSGAIFFLLIDDTDQVASLSHSDQLNRIWALLLAIRRLAGEVPALRCLVSLRTEAWTRLQSANDGQRDQTDHLRSLVVPLRVSDKLMKRVLRRRLELASEEVGRVGEDPYSVFFHDTLEDELEGNEQTGLHSDVEASESIHDWESFVVRHSRERPRDAINLIKGLAKCAQANGHSVIMDADANDVMPRYSRERMNDTCREFAGDCDSLQRVFDTFSGLPYLMHFEELRNHLKTVGSRFGLTARLAPAIHFQDEPDFIDRANWNAMQAAKWEIHPTFFRALQTTFRSKTRGRKTRLF